MSIEKLMNGKGGKRMKAEKINIAEKFEQVTEYWEPKIIEQMNDYQFKLAKFKGDFTWHDHKETDEVFFVIEGEMQIDFRDRSVVLKAGEMFVVSKGVEHKPYAKEECKVMLIESAGTVNTGDVVDA
jgi:mannose-6-phosphate isomerase-like protein (cupin superfamily)